MAASAQAQGVPGTKAYAAGQAGWSALRDGRHEEAARTFTTAIELAPRDGTFRFGAGVAAHLLGRTAEARDALERALRLAPGLADAALLLGEILYAAGDVDGAIRTAEDALARSPSHGALARRLERWRGDRERNQEFLTQQSGHFTVRFEGPADEDAARRALDVLEAGYWRIGSALSLFPTQPITVILHTAEEFRDVTRSPDWAAGLYDGWIRVPMRGALNNPEEMERVMVHELAHAFVRSIAPRGVPTWLNEGLAVLFEPDGLGWSQRQLGATNGRLALEGLSNGFGNLPGMRARLAYAQSALAVDRLIALGGPATLVTILRDGARGEPFAAAFEQRLLMSFSAFSAELETPGTALLR